MHRPVCEWHTSACRSRGQPGVGQTAGMTGLSMRLARSNQSVPTFEKVSEERRSTPRPAHASGARSSLVELRQESGARSVRSLRVSP